MAREAWAKSGTKQRVERFIQRNNLQGKRVLEVGAGSGFLQDVVSDYTGLDIAATAKRFFHKPFVQASATDLPFRDGEFDVIISMYTLEHVPVPEKALAEMRRVLKDKGHIYLEAAWDCPSWLAEGYPVRPYSDFGIGGKLIKASIPIRSFLLCRATYVIPIRLCRMLAAALGPTVLRYHPLRPNYTTYWVSDSDAVNSFDYFEVHLWFVSRGDECLNCGKADFLEVRNGIIPAAYRVRKQTGQSR